MPDGAGPRPRADVFYNPAMRLDRDLGVAFVRALARGRPRAASGWEVTAGTGVRGLRLVRETDAFASFLLTDAHPVAARVLAQNAARIPGATARHADGRTAPAEAPFDFVDVDPFGSPIPFVATALAATRDGGTLAVTATDLMVLAGAQPAAALRRYGARPVRGRLGGEGGLRILLAYLARSARADGRAVRPLLAYVQGHHVRAYVRVDRPPVTPDPIGEIDPARWTGPPVGETGPFGPMWLGPLFDAELVAAMEAPPTAATPREAAAWIERFRQETRVDRPFYYEPNELASVLGLPYPPSLEQLRTGLAARGHRFARAHPRPEGFRTDAPWATVAEVARAVAPQSQNARVRA